MTRKNKQKQNQNNKNKNNARPTGNRRSRKSRNQQQAHQNPTLGSIGGQIGTVAGNFLSKIFGLGAYKISKNSVFDSISNDQVPFMHSSSETVVLRHREYITDVSSSVAFTLNSYDVNPGLSSSFPFLSAIAANFQEYEFRGIVYEFKSTSASALNSTNTALGTVMLAAQYQADADDFVNKQQLLNEMWSVDAKPCDSFILPIECDPKENPFKVQYIRIGDVPSGADQKLYDLCKVSVATVGSQAAAVIGELWCTYEIALRKPRIASALNLSGKTAWYGFATTSTMATDPFGTPDELFDSIGVTFPTTNSVKFPLGSQGWYLVEYLIRGSSSATMSPAMFTAVNGTQVDLHGASPTYNMSNGTTVNVAFVATWIHILDPALQCTVTLPAGTGPTGTTTCKLLITQVNGDLS